MTIRQSDLYTESQKVLYRNKPNYESNVASVKVNGFSSYDTLTILSAKKS